MVNTDCCRSECILQYVHEKVECPQVKNCSQTFHIFLNCLEMFVYFTHFTAFFLVVFIFPKLSAKHVLHTSFDYIEADEDEQKKHGNFFFSETKI